TICCCGNATHALFYAWDAIVQCHHGNAQINLLLNRASPWLDVDSYLPYEGKVIIHNKSARRLLVRIPGFVDPKKVRSTINQRPGSPFLVGRYLVFQKVPEHSEVAIEFPLADTTEVDSF